MAEVLYLAQQLLNAITIGMVYGLLAIAYSLLYAAFNRINIAFGGLTSVAGFATLAGIAWFSHGRLLFETTIAFALLVALFFTSLVAWLFYQLVFRYLTQTSGQATLVAGVGLLIVVQEFLRLTQGADNQWLDRMSGPGIVLAAVDGFTVNATWLQFIVLIMALVSFILLVYIMEATRFGRLYRAVSQDKTMAELCGINVQNTIMWSFVLAGLYAALAGYLISIYYGVVNFHMGFNLGLKALTAAIVGGIGSIPGAMLGGLLIALVETLWSAYFLFEYREIGVFSLLIAFLVFKPEGLLGRR